MRYEMEHRPNGRIYGVRYLRFGDEWFVECVRGRQAHSFRFKAHEVDDFYAKLEEVVNNPESNLSRFNAGCIFTRVSSGDSEEGLRVVRD